MTYEEAMTILEQFKERCLTEPDKSIHYFSGYIMSAIASMSAWNIKPDTFLNDIKEMNAEAEILSQIKDNETKD